jgi:hypothetical protein
MINTEIKLQNSVSRRIWENYSKQINRIIKPLADKQKEEILLELQSHLYESMANDCAADEESRVLNAIEKLGDPNVFLQPIVKDKLLYNTLKSLSPVNVLLLFFKNLFSGIKKFVYSILIGVGYLISSILFLAGFFKIFYHEVGFYYFGPPWYKFFIGVVDIKVNKNGKELLGFWLIPLGIGASILIYYGLTKLLNRLNK